MFTSPVRRRRQRCNSTSPSPGGYDEAASGLGIGATPEKASVRKGRHAEGTPAKTTKCRPILLADAATDDDLKAKSSSSVLKHAAEQASLSAPELTSGDNVDATSTAALEIINVDRLSGAVEFQLDDNVYRVTDQAVLRSLISKSGNGGDVPPSDQLAAAPRPRRSTADFVKVQRAKRAAERTAQGERSLAAVDTSRQPEDSNQSRRIFTTTASLADEMGR